MNKVKIHRIIDQNLHCKTDAEIYDLFCRLGQVVQIWYIAKRRAAVQLLNKVKTL